MKSSSVIGLCFLLVALTLVAFTAKADTVGYWRFESEPNPNDPFPNDSFGPDFLKDSGPNNLDLTNPTVSNPTFVNPAGDAGHSPNSLAPGFANPIPQTGESNGRHAFTLNNDQFLFRPDEAIFNTGDFTIEAMVQFGADVINNGKNADIASQWGGGTNNAWRLLKNSGNQLAMGLSGNGFAFFTSPGFSFSSLTEYYVAAVVDIEADESTNVTFYVKDLTAGTPTEMIVGSTGASNIPGPINDSTSDFVIGGTVATADLAATRIDEVRLSAGLLAQSELLITSTPASIPGDFNGDGSVDNGDLNLLLSNWGSTTVPAEWVNGFDAPVDNVELNDLLSNWGVSATSVPEPYSVAISLLAITCVKPLRRRKLPGNRAA